MSDKNLLREGTVRRFMKLANVETLTNNFINEKYAEEEEEEGALEEQDLPEPDVEEEEGEEMELDLDPEPPVDDVAPDAALGEADISLTEEEAQLLIDLGERLKEAMGPAGEDMGDDMGDDMDAPDEEMADLDAPAEEEEVAAPALQENKDEIIKEVLRRVTKRILQKKASR